MDQQRRLSTLLLLWLIAWPATTAAAVYHVSPDDNWFGRIHGDGLQPGDEVVLAGGEYRDGRRLAMSHRGTAAQPVVIRAAAGERAVLHRPDARQNTINVVGAQHLILRGLEITGGSTGIRLMKSETHPCKFVTLEGMHIHHIGGVAVTANHAENAYEGLVFRGNHIHHTSGHGEGFYLGANNNADGSTAGYIYNSLIEGNYIHDLNGPGISQGDGIEIKDGSFNNIVRDNVIHDTNYPGVIVYGTDGKAPNVIERNVIWNSGDHGIQAAAEAVIRNNITFDNRGDGIHSHDHQSARVGNLQILHNTIVFRLRGGAGIRISPSGEKGLAGPVVIANNAIYVDRGGSALRLPSSAAAAAAMTVAGNVGSGKAEGLAADVGRAAFRSEGNLGADLDAHFFPRRGSTLIGAGNPRFAVADDFGATPRRSTCDTGAYAFGAGLNLGWKITPGLKKLAPTVK